MPKIPDFSFSLTGQAPNFVVDTPQEFFFCSSEQKIHHGAFRVEPAITQAKPEVKPKTQAKVFF
jgi:hypothetical protein